MAVAILLTVGIASGLFWHRPLVLEVYVSNQSQDIDPVDIRVLIDGNELLAQDFEFRDGHHYVRFECELRRGKHVLEAKSSQLKQAFAEEFRFRPDLIAQLDFAYFPKSPESGYSTEPGFRLFWWDGVFAVA